MSRAVEDRCPGTGKFFPLNPAGTIGKHIPAHTNKPTRNTERNDALLLDSRAWAEKAGRPSAVIDCPECRRPVRLKGLS